MHSPWKSAFSQSRGLSVLLRAWQITGDNAYLKICRKALLPFDMDTEEGGVRVDHNIGKTFYEEYVAAKPTRILDGHMFSLFGLFDFIRSQRETIHESNDLARRLFKEGINGLVQWLPEYDMGFWVHYNKCDLPDYPQNDPCTLGYLRLVSCQLKILAALSNNVILEEYSHKFRSYLKPENILKSYQLKLKTLKTLNRL